MINIKQTELTRIQNKLNSEFAGPARRIIFWYDESASFKDIIDNLQVDAKIYHLQKDNTFYTKYLLEVEDAESNYLVYADFAAPADEDNHLLDTVLYSLSFNPNPLNMFLNESRINEKYLSLLKKYNKFFDSADRKQKFINLGVEMHNTESIEVSIMSVLSNAVSSSFDEVIKKVLMGDIHESIPMKEFDKYDIADAFWKYCDKYYGYSEDSPNVLRLVAAMIITYAVKKLPVAVPGFAKFTTSKQGNVSTFISNFMHNVLCKDKFDILSGVVASELKVPQVIEKIATDDLVSCDAFDCIDKEIIKRCVALLVEDHALEASKYCAQRSYPQQFYSKYEKEYECLKNACSLIQHVAKYKAEDSHAEIIKAYTTSNYAIDMAYRKFYVAFDDLADASEFEVLRGQLENTYANGYLRKESVAWGAQLTKLNKDLGVSRQVGFYNREVARVKERLVVIISDALRYECAVQLAERLKSETYEPKLDYMVSSLPSYTALGMASLLPHDTITYSDDFSKIAIDGMPTADSKQRAAILNKYDEKSTVISLDEVVKMKQNEIRSRLKSSSLIYVYHNQIDSRGDKANCENEVFKACDEAIDEICKAVRVLTNHLSAANFIITADHGFIYKRDKIEESDKVPHHMRGDIMINKRFILSHGVINVEGAECLSMSNTLGKNSDICVTVPVGCDIFKAPGAGQNYVHGGASLQEMLIPSLAVHTNRSNYSREKKKVELSMLNLMSGKITNLITNIEFLQNQSVDDNYKAATFRICFEDENGNTVSGTETIVADKKSDNPAKRIFRRTFRLNEKKYNTADKYYLVIYDVDTNSEEQRKEFMIDIAFADDFGF